jgi:hypothetical protein
MRFEDAYGFRTYNPHVLGMRLEARGLLNSPGDCVKMVKRSCI